ncbi:MAG: hypothetical protein E6J20_02495 [Chloroflexi bacterium]|nr:MAG: hypothetical protein E6J20_02495 [Chloroflexota bacterium]
MRFFGALAVLIGIFMFSSPVAEASSLPVTVNGKHVMWGKGQGYPSAAQIAPNNLIYHGGLVETTPSVYLVYWGTEWQQGFSFTAGSFTYTNSTVQKYVNSFFTNVGGSPWAGVQTQYCQNIALASFSCAGQAGAQFVTNPSGQLKGTWTDPSPVPAEILSTGLAANATNDPIETEAVAAAAHFGYDVNATYFILTPPGHGAIAYGSVYCAYHSETAHTTGHGVRYAFMPYVPEQGGGCGQNSVNQNDAFGHGYLDGYSIVAGHEYAEAVTDPGNQMGNQDGWNDATGSENGDKCAWTGLQNISLGGNSYAVQPLWSNEAAGGAGACAVTR